MQTVCKELSAEVWLLLTLPHSCIGNVLQCWVFLIRALVNSKLGRSRGFEKSWPWGFLSPTLFHVTCKEKFWDFFGGCWNYHFELKRFFSNSEYCRLTFVRAGPKGETKSWAAADNGYNRLNSALYPVLLAPLITQGQLKTKHFWNITSLEWVQVQLVQH